ncbi:disease resistance protein RFL1-like [Mangifera indica]|uniref:disease resistance protein RFL1-like n=1 Tax=Mangifera indica TaxID=29780 RepID=UPI001CF9713F|nr:disease resistance protein RFL1-like [Mangifera indica]
MVDVAGNVGGAVSPVLQLAKWLAAPICRQFKYLFNYTTNFKNLEMEVGKLKNTRDEVERKIIAAERNVEVIKQNVKDWQKNVEETITKAEQLIQEKENNSRCFKGLSPNFIIHYKQSRKAFKLKRDGIDPLLQQERELSPVSYQTNPPEIWLRSSENYLAFESRNSTVKNVWDALNDENVFMIGVYGMGGLGKTTLVEELGRKAEKDKLFEDIVFLEVSESPDVKKIQTTIGNKLGLKFKNENESEMANKIYSRMKDKNILLILDNIWKPLEFEKTMGIPCGADRGRNKLLFTTRNLDVLERMGSTNNIGMGILNEGEAWTLFTKMAALTGRFVAKLLFVSFIA